MFRFKDQTASEVIIRSAPKRIISLVPSQTELLFDLDLFDNIIGITKFCVHPKPLCLQKINIGGTKKVNHEKIEQLQPDLIIGNKEENTASDIDRLKENYPVWLSDIVSIDDALDMIQQIGEITTRKEQSLDLIKQIQNEFNRWEEHRRNELSSAVYLIWKDPYMAAGNNTFINSMMECFGWKNLMGSIDRYPELSIEELRELQPEHILLSSEPFPFNSTHFNDIQQQCPNSKIHLIDARYFSWYGSRMLGAPQYFHKLTTILNK